MNVLSVIMRAFVPVSTSYGWAWGTWPGTDPLGVEKVTSVSELPRVLRSYALTVSTMLRLADVGDRFNVTVIGATSGSVYGRDQWIWQADTGRYQPHGTPWVPRTEALDADLAVNSIVIPFGRGRLHAPDMPMAA